MATTLVTERTYSNLELAVYHKSPDGTSLRSALRTILGTEEAANTFLVEVFNQARHEPRLSTCSIESIQFHLLRVAQLHLNPALPNEVFFIPRNTKQPDGRTYQYELTVQYGYGGLRKLILRSPEVVDVFTKEVCILDRFEPPLRPTELPVHQLPGNFQPRGRVIGYYAAAQVRSGHWRTVLMSVAEVEAHADRYAKSDGKFGPAWSKGQRPDIEHGLCPFDKQALKTCLRMLCNARDLTLTAELTEVLTLETLPETSASLQGYQTDGTRPALVQPRPAETMEVLLQDLSGAEDKKAIAATLQTLSSSVSLTHTEEYIPRIEAIVSGAGGDLVGYWTWAVKRCKRATRAALTAEDYQLLLSLAQAHAAKRTEEARQRETEQETSAHQQAPSAEPSPLPSWREALASMASTTLAMAHEAPDAVLAAQCQEISHQAMTLAEDATATEAEGQACLEAMAALGQVIGENLGLSV